MTIPNITPEKHVPNHQPALETHQSSLRPSLSSSSSGEDGLELFLVISLLTGCDGDGIWVNNGQYPQHLTLKYLANWCSSHMVTENKRFWPTPLCKRTALGPHERMRMKMVMLMLMLPGRRWWWWWWRQQRWIVMNIQQLVGGLNPSEKY